MSMRSYATFVTVAVLSGCAGAHGPAAGHPGAPNANLDPAVLAPSTPRQAEAPRLPDRITLPASYRLVLLDGHLTLVRETDVEALEGAPASMRIVTGEIARGELAYQPALLPQELAAEVAANRESMARMDDALQSVMSRSRELSEQAKAAQAQAEKLSALLASAEARLSDATPRPKVAVATAVPDDARQ